MLFNGYRNFVLQDEKSSGDWLHNNVNIFITIELFILPHVHVKVTIVNLMLCVFYHSWKFKKKKQKNQKTVSSEKILTETMPRQFHGVLLPEYMHGGIKSFLHLKKSDGYFLCNF